MATAAEHPLARYLHKREFNRTPEPHGEDATALGGQTFVVQKHAAGRLHYDFRLEMNGVLVSWALPKGPSFDPADKRIAVHVEDHPLSYGSFEGLIPPKQYGAGSVIVWDHGTWEPERQQGWRGDIRTTTENARLGAREFLVRKHAALVQRTQSTQFFA